MIQFTKGQLSTAGAILAVLLGLLLWDVFLLKDDVEGNTISAVLRLLANCPTVPLFFGILAGHVFWPKRGLRPAQQSAWNLGLMIGILVASYLWYNFSFGPVMSLLSKNPIAVFAVAGMSLGHSLWPQYTKEMGA